MVSNNWLLNYRHPWGIHRSFEGLVYRARYMDDPLAAVSVFENKYEQFRKYFEEFFPELEEFARDQLNNIEEPG
jgi:acyl carrier protein phosphodiesterase